MHKLTGQHALFLITKRADWNFFIDCQSRWGMRLIPSKREWVPFCVPLKPLRIVSVVRVVSGGPFIGFLWCREAHAWPLYIYHAGKTASQKQSRTKATSNQNYRRYTRAPLKSNCNHSKNFNEDYLPTKAAIDPIREYWAAGTRVTRDTLQQITTCVCHWHWGFLSLF